MALKTFVAGEVLTAADVNEYLVNSPSARKTSDETINNATTLQDDDHLVLTNLTASAIYEIRLILIYTSVTATPDLKIAFTLPAGSAQTWAPVGLDPTATTATSSIRMDATTGTTSRTIGTIAGTDALALVTGTLVMGGSAGSLQFQWAQNSATAENTTIKTGSLMIARRVL